MTGRTRYQKLTVLLSCHAMANIGYARVSTNGQDLAGQVAELEAACCGKVNRGKVSGATTDRAELAKLLGRA
jgi:DNA invertase Pin-like site-specific DNA recombinase